MVRLIISAVFLAFFFISGDPCDAATSPCPESTEAHGIVNENQLKNWNDIYQSVKKYESCDAGVMSEAYSYVVVYTLAHKWETLGEFKKLISIDKSFEQFVIKHINATADPRDIVKVLSNVRERCPGEDVQLCLTIEKAVRKSLQDLGALRK